MRGFKRLACSEHWLILGKGQGEAKIPELGEEKESLCDAFVFKVLDVSPRPGGVQLDS
jgi:hypothetical protein